MRQKKASHKRIEVRVVAFEKVDSSRNSSWAITIYDTAGQVASASCVSRNNVAFKATQEAARALSVPEGRIKINRVEYV